MEHDDGSCANEEHDASNKTSKGWRKRTDVLKKTSVIGNRRQRWNMMRGVVRVRNTTRVTKHRKVGEREDAKGVGDRRGGDFVF